MAVSRSPAGLEQRAAAELADVAPWTAPAASGSALAAALALPLFRPATLALTAMAVLLLAVHREDRRNAWRYAPEPVPPARFLPPRPVKQTPVIDLTQPAEPAALIVAAVHVPTQVVPLPSIPKTRVAVADPHGGALPRPVKEPRPATAAHPRS